MQRLKYVTFTANGNWTAPAGVTTVFLFGRGGSAGGCGASWPGANGFSFNPQGGGGCWSTWQAVSVVPNTTYTVTIGAKGTGGTGTTSSVGYGTGGGDSTFGSLATFKGATAAPSSGIGISHGLTAGGFTTELTNGHSQYGHDLLGGQRSPFAVGGTGATITNGGTWNYGGGGAGDGYGGNASSSTTGSNGSNGGGGGAGSPTGGNGTDGQIVVAWID